MKAILREVYGPPEILRFGEAPTPNPGPGEVLVAVRNSSLNTADLDQLAGRPRIVRLGTGISRPRSHRLGLDLAGVVVEVGEGVTRFEIGDRVWADTFAIGGGAFAEFVCGREDAFLPLPTALSFADAAVLPHSGLLALQGLDAAGGVRAGDRVLINGAGGCVGPLAIQIAKARGAHVTGVDHGSKLDFIVSAGADEVIDYTTGDFTRPGGRFDYILDVAARRSLISHRRALVGDGTYVHIARNLGGFFRAAVFGAFFTLVSRQHLGTFFWVPNRASDMNELARLVTTGAVTPLIDREVSLEQVPEAMSVLAEGRARGKLVVSIPA